MATTCPFASNTGLPLAPTLERAYISTRPPRTPASVAGDSAARAATPSRTSPARGKPASIRGVPSGSVSGRRFIPRTVGTVPTMPSIRTAARSHRSDTATTRPRHTWVDEANWTAIRRAPPPTTWRLVISVPSARTANAVPVETSPS
jgi:hypothetical protein